MIETVEYPPLQSVSGFTTAAWFVSVLLAIALIGLVHDMEYAHGEDAVSVEDGGQVENQVDFEQDALAAKPHRVIGFAALFCVGLYCAISAPRGARYQIDVLMILIVLGLFWTATTMAWSVEPSKTMRELVRLSTYVFVGAAVARRFDARTLCLIFTAAFGCSVLAAIAVEFATGGFRPWTPGYRLSGSMHSNGVGIQATLVGLAAYGFARERKSRSWSYCWYGIFLAALAIVVLSKSRTSQSTFLAGILAIHAIGASWQRIALAVSAATMLAATLSIGYAAFDLGADRLLTQGREDDAAAVSGRLPLWDEVWDATHDWHWQGVGYGAFWTVHQIESLHSELGWYPNHAHNAYLQVVVDSGLIGLAFLLAVGICAISRTARMTVGSSSAEYVILTAWMFGFIVHGFTETAVVTPRDVGLCVAAVVFSCVGLGAPASVPLQPGTSPADIPQNWLVDKRRKRRRMRWPLLPPPPRQGRISDE